MAIIRCACSSSFFCSIKIGAAGDGDECDSDWELGPPFVLSLPHTLLGAPGAAGQGSTVLTLAIPPDPGLLGTPFFFQAAYFDSGAPRGVALTAGVSGTIQ